MFIDILDEIAVVTIIPFIMFFLIRININYCTSSLVNKNNYKKRKKHQNFFEWFSFTRFKDLIFENTITKIYLFLYYFNIIVWIVFCIVGVLAVKLGFEYRKILYGYFIVMISILSIQDFIDYDYKNHRIIPGRFLKKRGNKKRKK